MRYFQWYDPFPFCLLFCTRVGGSLIVRYLTLFTFGPCLHVVLNIYERTTSRCRLRSPEPHETYSTFNLPLTSSVSTDFTDPKVLTYSPYTSKPPLDQTKTYETTILTSRLTSGVWSGARTDEEPQVTCTPTTHLNGGCTDWPKISLLFRYRFELRKSQTVFLFLPKTFGSRVEGKRVEVVTVVVTTK